MWVVGEDRQDATGHPSTERVSVPQAADHLGTTVDAIRKRVQRKTIPHDRDRDGRVWILLDTGRPRQDADQDTVQPQSDSAALISAKDETIATLREQLEAERNAHAEARRLLLEALTKIPTAIEAPSAEREPPETVEEAPEGEEIREELSAERARREMAESTLHEGMGEERRRREEAERERDELRREMFALREPRGAPETAEAAQQGGGEPQPEPDRVWPERAWWRRIFRR